MTTRKAQKRPAPARRVSAPAVPRMTPQERANLSAVLRLAQSGSRPTSALPRTPTPQTKQAAPIPAPAKPMAKATPAAKPPAEKLPPRAPPQSTSPNHSDPRNVLLEQLRQIQATITNHAAISRRLPTEKREPNLRAMIASRNNLIKIYLENFPKHAKDIESFRNE